MPNSRIQRYLRHGTLTQLRVLDAIARHGSFTRAGEELHMAQPTVSVHMKKLTETIGVPLVQPVGKKVQLTAVGEEVRATCIRIFEAFSDLHESISDLHGLRSGRLRIGTTTAGECLMPQLLAAFVRKHPAIEVSVHVSSRQALVERLDDNADDLYLFANPPTDDSLAVHPVLPNPLVAIGPASHPLAHEKSVAFERFAHEPLLMRERGSGTRLAVERLFAEHHLRPHTKMELGSNETIREAIVAGLGVSLVYRYALGFDLDPRRIAILAVEGIPSDSHWHLIHPANRQLSFIAQTFLAFARREAQRIFEERVSAYDGSTREPAPADFGPLRGSKARV
jgi:DNA-binding transcriptional LysR family regulator